MAGPPFTIDTSHPAPTNLVSQFPTNETANRQAILDWLTFLSDPTTGIINTAALPTIIDKFPSGTRLAFQQTAAPTGWTKIVDSNFNDRAMRVVTGTVSAGGLYGFSAIFNSARVSNATTLTSAQVPAHSHTYSGTTAVETQNHSHAVTVTGTTDAQGVHTHGVGYAVGSSGGGFPTGNANRDSTFTSDAAGNHVHNVSASGNTGAQIGNHNHTFSGTTSSVGSGGSHTHGMELGVLYIDVILAQKA